MPACPRTKHPQNSVDELAIIRRRTANVFHSTRKRVLDPLPLPLAQLISARHATSATNQTPAAKSICGYRLERVDCPRAFADCAMELPRISAMRCGAVSRGAGGEEDSHLCATNAHEWGTQFANGADGAAAWRVGRVAGWGLVVASTPLSTPPCPAMGPPAEDGAPARWVGSGMGVGLGGKRSSRRLARVRRRSSAAAAAAAAGAWGGGSSAMGAMGPRSESRTSSSTMSSGWLKLSEEAEAESRLEAEPRLSLRAAAGRGSRRFQMASFRA